MSRLRTGPLDIDAAVDHLMAVSRRIGLTALAIEELRHLALRDDRDDPMARRLRVRLAAIEAGSDSTIIERVRAALSRRYTVAGAAA